MQYNKMKCSKIMRELDSEEKARAWIWLAKFDGKEFNCPKCESGQFYQHKKKSPEIRECKQCHFEVRLSQNIRSDLIDDTIQILCFTEHWEHV